MYMYVSELMKDNLTCSYGTQYAKSQMLNLDEQFEAF